MKISNYLRLFVPFISLILISSSSFSFDSKKNSEKPVTDTTSLADLYEDVFAQLNRGDVTTGFLAERRFPLISIEPFNGVLTDSNKVTIDTWRALYFTLWTSRLDQNIQPFYHITTVNAAKFIAFLLNSAYF